jgi:predicted nuclease of predicted toxin-antitoxin system
LTKILADENIPIEAVKLLQSKGVDLVSVTEFLQGFSDLEVLELANRENRAILTFDKDFGEMVVRENLRSKG